MIKLGYRFYAYAMGLLIDRIGSAMYMFILPIFIYNTTNSLSSMTVMIVLQMLPRLLFGVVVGAIIDRTPHRTILFVFLIIQSILNTIFAVLYMYDALSITLIYIIGTIISFCFECSRSAEIAIVPVMFKDNRVKATSYLGILFTVGFTIGPLIAGFLSVYISYQSIFLFNSITYLAPILMHTISKIPNTHYIHTQRQTLWVSIHTALQKIRDRNILNFVLITVIFYTLIGYMFQNAIIIYYAKSELSQDDFFVAQTLAIYGIGMILGMLNAVICEKYTRKLWLSLSIILVIIGTLITLYSHDYTFIIAVLFISFGIHSFSILRDVLIQELIPHDMIVRIGTLIRSVSQGMTAVSMVGATFLTQYFSIQLIFTIPAIGFTCLLFWVYKKKAL